MRLIDADALKERAIRVSTVKEHCYFKAVGTREIDKAPTIDAAPVVHGRWIHASNKPGVWIGMKCSLCGARIKYSEFINGNHKYCHKCGAKMDGETNENQTSKSL